jgi:hypothetical protein
VRFGVGRFEDCGYLTEEGVMECAHGCHNLLDMTASVVAAQSVFDSLTDLCGGAEPSRQMLWLLATGDTSGYGAWVEPRPRRCTDSASVGWPCFRSEATRIAILCFRSGFDASASCDPDPGWAAVLDALTAESIRVVGLTDDDIVHRLPIMRALAESTNAVDPLTGRPLVFTFATDGTGTTSGRFDTAAVIEAVDNLARSAPIRLDARLFDGLDEPPHDPPVDAVAAFIDYLETNTAGEPVFGPTTGIDRICAPDLATGDADADGHADYVPVATGQSVCWDVRLRRNETVPGRPDGAQVFSARIDILGDELYLVAARQLYFLVPATVRPFE